MGPSAARSQGQGDGDEQRDRRGGEHAHRLLHGGAAAIHFAAGKTGSAFARQGMYQKAAGLDFDGNGARGQGDRVGVDHQSHVRLLRRSELDERRRDRQSRMQDAFRDVPAGLYDLPGKPRPVGKTAPTRPR